MTERPQSPLSGAGGVNIIRENCLRKAWARVSFSAQRKKRQSVDCLFSLKVRGFDRATPISPFRGWGCKYNSREMPTTWARVSFSAHETKKTAFSCLFRFVKFEAEACTSDPKLPFQGSGWVNLQRHSALKYRELFVARGFVSYALARCNSQHLRAETTQNGRTITTRQHIARIKINPI